ncbi:MAG TPA: flagellar hook-basal body complex protein FliE [Spirochaetota bacterium]|nr:flagellar hook-basal body complex protein FliE [Spirochaetota bacterium]HOM37806.1 flagellar hook-basal body complex protein FliE [Spirochaetota bacterium]HPQ49317.1 flagellar hook-basal body complex protein FliE [Spirochaetota bacterium]
MRVYNPYLKPYDVNLKINNNKHISDNLYTRKPDNVVGSFGEALNNAFSNLNDLQINAEQLQVKMVTDPESVNPHEVSIAQTKAELALSFAKSVITRLVDGFKELQNLR